LILKRKNFKLISLENDIKNTADEINDYLKSVFSYDDEDFKIICDSVNYSLLNGGKRIRPFILISFCEMFGGKREKAIAFASALEMIHTYSLIHDDLPCMDDDDQRRGKPSNHKVYGEANALLAGDALLTEAFSVALKADLPAETLVLAIKTLSSAAGYEGMIGGQVMDMSPELLQKDVEKLKKMYSLKTGKLISAAAILGCLAANVRDEATLKSAERYAQKIGLAFQIVDDLLDKFGTEEDLGKPIGSDDKNDKTTFLLFASPEEARAYAKKLTEEAVSEIERYSGNEKLVSLAYLLLERKK
jgi:geranylgeranyl diphosphate synthase type II